MDTCSCTQAAGTHRPAGRGTRSSDPPHREGSADLRREVRRAHHESIRITLPFFYFPQKTDGDFHRPKRLHIDHRLTSSELGSPQTDKLLLTSLLTSILATMPRSLTASSVGRYTSPQCPHGIYTSDLCIVAPKYTSPRRGLPTFNKISYRSRAVLAYTVCASPAAAASSYPCP